MHIHTSPDVAPRLMDDIEVAQAAKDAGMRAILIKSHHTMTADRAAIAQRVVGGIRVFGGIALNAAVGGLNPAAVEMALRMGAKEVWMPTRSAAHVLKQEGRSDGIELLDETGELLPVVRDLAAMIHEADVILATGHIGPQESAVLVREAKDQGLRKIVVTHPEAAFIRMPVELQQEMYGEGVYFERCYVDTTPTLNCEVSMEAIAEAIRRVGFESTVLSTDFGQEVSPPPTEGMRAYLSALEDLGFQRREINKMAGDNPAFLLDL
jgi:hypothetical protein